MEKEKAIKKEGVLSKRGKKKKEESRGREGGDNNNNNCKKKKKKICTICFIIRYVLSFVNPFYRNKSHRKNYP